MHTKKQCRTQFKIAYRSLCRAALLGLILFWCSFPALAQLSDEAREALNQGGQVAAQALATYDTHYLDRPLWREAIRYGERAKALAPNDPEPYRFLGQVYSIINWYSRAWDAWNMYTDLGGQLNAQSRRDLAEVSEWLGNQSFDGGNYQNAVIYYETLAELEPENQEALSNLASSYLELGQPQAAQPYLNTLETQNPGAYGDLIELSEEQALYGARASAAYREGLALIEAGDLEGGIESLESAVNINDNFLDAFILAAETNLDLGRPANALNFWRGAANIAPNDPSVERNLAATQERLEYGESAYTAFQQGLSALAAGNETSAAQRFRAAVSEASDYTQAYGYLGQIALNQGNLELAEDYYAEASRLEPSNAEYGATYASVLRQLEAQEQAQLAEERAQAAEEARLEAEAARQEAQTEARAQAEEAARLAAQEAARLEEEAAELEAERQAAQEEAAALAEERQAAEEARLEAEAQAEAEAAQEEALAAERLETQEQARLEAQAEAERLAEEAEAERLEEERLALESASELRASVPVGSDSGEPVVLVDETHTHQNGSAFWFLSSPASVQESLTLPVNYAAGTLYERLEVLNKPGNETVQYQLCLVHNDGLELSPACRNADTLSFSRTGVFETSQRMNSLSNYGNINWNQGLRELLLVIKDEDGNAADTRYGAQTGGDLSSFYPMEVRYTAILVPPAGVFPGWP